MKTEDILTYLCTYDPRNPHNTLDSYEDGEKPQPRQPLCGCHNCHFGRDKLAVALLEAQSRGPLLSYHFDIGDSNTGPIGISARVVASSPEEAVDILCRSLPDEFPVPHEVNDAVEYIQVYINTSEITPACIHSADKPLTLTGVIR